MSIREPYRDFSLKNKVALVTGACGQLGSHFCKTLAAGGARVIVTDLDEVRCRRFAKILTRHYRRPMLGISLDVRDHNQVNHVFQTSIQWAGKLDILVNNAGIGVFTPWERRQETELDAVYATNVKGVINCTKAAAHALGRHGGSIINIGSVYGTVSADPRIYGKSGRNSSEIYAATKAGVIHLTRYWAVHLANQNIRVNTISPGGIFNHQAPEFVRQYEQRTPLGRMGNPKDLTGVLIFLASKASTYVTGHNLIVDGGFSAW